MSKKTGKPWYRKATDAWYVQRDGVQIRLAAGRGNRAAAYARFAELLAGPPPQTERPGVTLGEMVDAYRAHIRDRVKATTGTSYGCVLKPLVAALGNRWAVSVTADDLEQWSRRASWSPTTRRYALTVAAGAFKWAHRAGLIESNPVAVLKRPAGRSRGAAVLIDGDLHARILGVVSPQFADFITVVRATGARPGEVARLEAKHLIWESACWALAEHKTASRGHVRTIFMPPSVVPLVRRLAELRPSGPIFLNSRGVGWVKTGWKQAMERAQKCLGLALRPLVSGYRHTFATDALTSGVPDTHVAELLGHSSTAMVAKHYGHLAAKSRVLRDSLTKFRGDAPAASE